MSTYNSIPELAKVVEDLKKRVAALEGKKPKKKK
jgi:hypothetical protein